MSELALDRDVIHRPNITNEELEAIAEQKAAYILEKINSQSKKIDEAKAAAHRLKNQENPGVLKRIFSNDHHQIMKDAVIAQSSAIVELNDLVKESVNFACASIQFAQIMHKKLASMMANGFKDVNGNLQKLAGSSAQFAEEILTNVEDHVDRLSAVEKTQAELQASLRSHKEEILTAVEKLAIMHSTAEKSHAELQTGLHSQKNAMKLPMTVIAFMLIALIVALVLLYAWKPTGAVIPLNVEPLIQPNSISAAATANPAEAPQKPTPLEQLAPVIAPIIEPTPTPVTDAVIQQPQVSPQLTWAPSFDCAKVSTGTERLICSNKELAEVDVKLSQVYREAFNSSPDKQALQREQNSWRKNERDACVDVDCIAMTYQQRISQLLR